MPYLAFISGLTKRQPMVVSSIFAARENALSALPITNGARDMLSTPPAITSDASPHLMARAATPIASMLDPHSRLTVAPGTSWGMPASRGHVEVRDVRVDAVHAPHPGERISTVLDDLALALLGLQIHHHIHVLGADREIHRAANGGNRIRSSRMPVGEVAGDRDLKRA